VTAITRPHRPDDPGSARRPGAQACELTEEIQNGYELAHAGEALAAFRSTHTQGKVSISIS
jgi:hypothetical protein